MIKKITVFIMALAAVCVIIGGQKYSANKHEQVKAEAEKANVVYLEKKEKIKVLEEMISKDFPGIVTWGDSLTLGAGGDGVSYPSVLQQLIHKNVYNLPVVNLGVGGEATNTIMGRAGSISFEVGAFTVPAERSPIEITLSSSNGSSVSPLIQGDGGINPVIIDGIKGTLSVKQDSRTHYFFQRSEPGNAVSIKENTEVKTAAADKYQNYIPIVLMGQNGGYKDNQDLIDQINSIVRMEKYNDKYLVLGLTTGSAASRADLERQMASTFGDRYLNIRDYIVSKGLQMLNITPTDKDSFSISSGSVPPSLLADQVHFNSKGYTVIGTAVYERMSELGYFDEIKSLGRQIEDLNR